MEPELHLEFWSFCYAIQFSCGVISLCRLFVCGVHYPRARFHSGQPLAGNMMSQSSRYAIWINVLWKLGFFWSTFFSPGKHSTSSFIQSDEMTQHRLNEFFNLALICDAVLVYIIFKCFQGSTRSFNIPYLIRKHVEKRRMGKTNLDNIKETVGNSWDILNAILGHKYQQH